MYNLAEATILSRVWRESVSYYYNSKYICCKAILHFKRVLNENTLYCNAKALLILLLRKMLRLNIIALHIE